MSRILATDSPRSEQSIRSGGSSTRPPPATQTESRRPGLAQRLLSSNPSTPLPPLFPLSNPELSTLNDQVYHFLALALRAFVSTWWSKLSPKDKDLLPQIAVVLRHVVHVILERAREANLVELTLVQLPTLLRQHYADYHHAKSKLGTSYAISSPSDLPHIFHHLQPHIAIRMDDESRPFTGLDGTAGIIDPTYLSASVDSLLKACLPEEDAHSDLERHIVREIIVGPILGSALPNITQPWFIYNCLLNALGGPKSNEEKTTARPRSPSPTAFHSITVMFLTAVQAISTFCLKVIHLSHSIIHLANSINTFQSSKQIIRTRWEALTILFSTKGPRLQCRGTAYPTLALVREVLNLKESSQPSPMAAAVLNSLDITAAFSEPFLDRLLPYLLWNKVFTPSTFSSIVLASTDTLFPASNNGYPGPPPDIPTETEQLLIRKKLEKRLGEIIPSVLRLPAAPTQILDPLSSAECNAHLIILVFDLILVTLFPEMAAQVTGDEQGQNAREGMDTP
ncbi:hypothetical protein FRB99_005514 [Tulasnella sp. 403]|nr:hypothetical protein FRB99_005514 [Tulasnella sp. 403]